MTWRQWAGRGMVRHCFLAVRLGGWEACGGLVGILAVWRRRPVAAGGRRRRRAGRQAGRRDSPFLTSSH